MQLNLSFTATLKEETFARRKKTRNFGNLFSWKAYLTIFRKLHESIFFERRLIQNNFVTFVRETFVRETFANFAYLTFFVKVYSENNLKSLISESLPHLPHIPHDLTIYWSNDLSIYWSTDLTIYRSIDLSIYRSNDLSI